MQEQRDSRGKPDFRKRLEGDGPTLTEAQRTELDDRVARYERNPSDVIRWEQVRAGLVVPRRPDSEGSPAR